MRLTTTMGLAAGAVLLSVGLIKPAQAVPVDADIMYVVDKSGSMDDEFDFLAGAIEGFLNDLEASPSIGSVRGGLISYTDSPTLEQGLTSNASDLSAAFSGFSAEGGIENAFAAMDAAMPGGNTDLGLGYRDSAVKSLIVITDEDPDDGPTGSSSEYSNGLTSGGSTDDIAALLDDNGFLNNIIREEGDWDSAEEAVARPTGALFSISTFRDNREQFFADFTDAKIQEIEETTEEVPAPATLALFGLGLLGLGGLLYAGRESS